MIGVEMRLPVSPRRWPRCRSCRRRTRLSRALWQRDHRHELLQDIAHRFHQLCPLANELVATAGEWIVDRPRDCEYLTPLLDGVPGRYEGATAHRCFDHQDADGQAADDTIALWKGVPSRRGAGRELRHHRPVSCN